ncbi:hypothetical protein [uncultured Roseobacter sp.]|uniref:hypothetical protein n=1 Tax=uncultured Roseobacter sp. TaxID=114847 RepID=UPI002612B086|nr:hypothetical protein [uncultured Roseobacter sp.]
MPNLSLYIPLSRSRGVLLRLVAVLIRSPRRLPRDPYARAHLPAYLREDVGLEPEVEHPPPLSHLAHRFPF